VKLFLMVFVSVISSVFLLYTTPLFCSSSFIDLCSTCAETWFIYNNIFAVEKKNSFCIATRIIIRSNAKSNWYSIL
jgi:hypothetical protein